MVRGLRAVGRWGLRLAVSLAVVAFILHRVSWGELWRDLGGVHLAWVVMAVGLYLAGQVLSACKWRILGRAVGLSGTFGEYARFYFVGMFFNTLGISTLGGDVVRALYLGRGRRPGLAINSVLFDRVSGLAILMALGSVALLAFPEYSLPGPIGPAVMAGGLLLLIGWWTCPVLVELLPAGNRLRAQVETELAPFWRDRSMLLCAAAVSLSFHLSQVWVQWVLCRAVGVPVPFAYCLVFHPILSVAMAIPVSIGGFGVREAGYIYCLGRIGVPASIAVAAGLLWWAVTVVAGLVGGVLFLTSRAELPKRRTDARRATT